MPAAEQIDKRRNFFGFQDEVGLLHTPKEDRVFGLGLLKLEHPRLLHQEICRLKNQRKFVGEFKFADINKRAYPLYRDFINIFFATSGVYFSCLMFDKENIDLKSFFRSDHHLAYNAFLASLIARNLEPYEYIAMLADDVSTPKSDNYERAVRKRIKRKLGRNALFGICRLESHAVSEIQMTDVLLGTVAYDFKLKYGLIKPNPRSGKFRIMEHLRKRLNLTDLSTTATIRKPVHFSVEEFRPMDSPRIFRSR